MDKNQKKNEAGYVFDWGINKGKLLSEVPVSYIIWVLETPGTHRYFDEDQMRELIAEANRRGRVLERIVNPHFQNLAEFADILRALTEQLFESDGSNGLTEPLLTVGRLFRHAVAALELYDRHVPQQAKASTAAGVLPRDPCGQGGYPA
jgi:hypothetical protein